MTAWVTVRYFAMLRELAGTSEERCEFPFGETAAGLYRRIAARYGFALKPEELRFAVNDRFVAADRELSLGDVLVFVPPVAGG